MKTGEHGRQNQPLGPAAWEQVRLPDILAPGLDIVFVGYNPGRWSARQGHHFAGPGNHFWALLAEAGITPQRLTPADDAALLRYGLGVTNIVARPSPGSGDLSYDELLQGGALLVEKLKPLKPRIVCLLGKDVYRGYAGLPKTRAVSWGAAESARIPGCVDFTAPNPSPRSTIPRAQRLEIMRQLQALRRDRCGFREE
ncbi:MAG TPA: mismatch-specific DNA-glycosylase [Firmicutes bacterium]|nr:mismatch-specific DNA-glycosylase [Bacillota bacterium]